METQSNERTNLIEMVRRAYAQNLELKRRYVLRNFWAFSKEVVGWKDLEEALHKDLCDRMQEHSDKKRLLLIPRGHLKSSVVTVGYSLWRIAQNPKIRILIANGTYEMAVTFLAQIKQHLEKNKAFIELFGDLTNKTEKWSENQITVKREDSYDVKEPTVTAFGIGGNLVSQHYDLIIGDDVVNRDNIHTPDRMYQVKMFYKDVQDLVDNPTESEIIFIGTRWHEADLYGQLLDPENPENHQYYIYQRTAVEGDYRFVKNPNTGLFEISGGDIIFPRKFSRQGLESLLNGKGIGEFSAQYMNNPVPSETATFKHEFKYYEPEDMRGVEMYTFCTIDPAFYDPKSKTVDLDYAVFMVISVDGDNNWYIKDIVRERMTPYDIIEMTFHIDTMYHPKTIGLETTAYQKILGHMLRDEMKTRNQFLYITELKHAGGHAKSKADRIQGLEPRYAMGSIFHNQYVRNIAILEDELRRFPRSKTDDCIDALASMLEIAHAPRVNKERSSDGIKKFWNYPA
jgi:phage terminase large subunit-like protein